MANIEFIQGSEQHSSNWGKFFIKGLEAWQVKEGNTSDKHQSYQEYQCNDIPEGSVFTIFEQSGNKLGCDTFYFSICVATDSEINLEDTAYGSGKITGNFKIIAQAVGSTKAPRLMGWWIDDRKDSDPYEFALHCANYIDKRGIKTLPPLVAAFPEADPAGLSHQETLIQGDLARLVKKYGLEEIKEAIAYLK